MQRRSFLAALGTAASGPALIARGADAQPATPPGYRITTWDAKEPGSTARVGSRDVTAAGDGTFWVCGQGNGTMLRLNPANGEIRRVSLGQGAAPHGVIRGPDGAAWITEGGQNAIARVDPRDHRVQLWKLPDRFANGNLNTGVFDTRGTYWFTGQNGILGRFTPATERMDVWEAPRGRGPYGITRTPQGTIWFVSLAGNYLAQIDDLDTGHVRVLDPPTPRQGARRVWTDSRGQLWVSEWNSGNVSMYNPAENRWGVWKLPGERPRCYSVWVDPTDKVWLTDFGANAIIRFDPANQSFLAFPAPRQGADVRQMDGVDGQAWGAERANDKIVRIEYGL